MNMTFAEKNNFLISLSMSPKADMGKVAFEQVHTCSFYYRTTHIDSLTQV